MKNPALELGQQEVEARQSTISGVKMNVFSCSSLPIIFKRINTFFSILAENLECQQISLAASMTHQLDESFCQFAIDSFIDGNFFTFQRGVVYTLCTSPGLLFFDGKIFGFATHSEEPNSPINSQFYLLVFDFHKNAVIRVIYDGEHFRTDRHPKIDSLVPGEKVVAQVKLAKRAADAELNFI